MLITPNLWNFQRVLNTLAATQEVPRHTRFQSRGSTRVPPTSRGAPFPLHSSRGGILFLCGRERIPGDPVASQVEALTTGKARGTPGSCHYSQSPPDAQSITGKPVSQHCLDFQAKDDSQHGGTWDSPVGKRRGKASWQSLVRKPPRKATDSWIHAKGRVTLLLQLGRKLHMHAPNRYED